MARQGKCTNFGNCTKADNGEVIPEIMGQPFNCPECELPLVEINKSSKKKWVLASIVLLAILGGLWWISSSCLFDASGCVPQPPCDHALNDGICVKLPCDGVLKDGICVPEPPTVLGECTLAPIETPTKPNWYAVIEIGSKGVKPIAVEFQPIENGDLIPKTFHPLKTQNVMPKEEARIPDVVKAICEDINLFHAEYGKLPMYLVGSSGMAQVAHRAKLEEAITKAIQLPVDFLNAEQEVSYLAKGIWMRPLPMKRHCESAVIDVGSGNIKGGYLEHCNPERESPEEKLVSFDIQKFGTAAFSEQAGKKVTGGITFNEGAAKIRKTLEDKIDEQVRTRPELTNGKKRIYLVGGAAWALNTLLCLDCPQYRERSITDDQNEYTVIKPKDIEEFYKFVTQDTDKICDSAVENPYIRRNLDGNEMIPLEEDDINKQKDKIQAVCQTFTANNDLISAAEILRAIAKKMEITDNRHLFFMQNNLYTWSRQYLIEKIKKQSQ